MQKIYFWSTWGEFTLQFDIRRQVTAPKVNYSTKLQVPKSTPVNFLGSTPTSRQGRGRRGNVASYLQGDDRH